MFCLSFSAYRYLLVAPVVSATNVQGFKVTANLNDGRGKGTPTFFQLQYRVRTHLGIICNIYVLVIWQINNSAGTFDKKKVFSWLKRITQNSGKGVLCLFSCHVAWIETVMNGNIQIFLDCLTLKVGAPCFFQIFVAVYRLVWLLISAYLNLKYTILLSVSASSNSISTWQWSDIL